MSCTDLVESRGRRAISPRSFPRQEIRKSGTTSSRSGRQRTDTKRPLPHTTSAIAMHATIDPITAQYILTCSLNGVDLRMNQSNLARVDSAQYRMSDVALATFVCLCRVAPLSRRQNAGKGGRHQVGKAPREEDKDKVWTIGSRFSTPSHYW